MNAVISPVIAQVVSLTKRGASARERAIALRSGVGQEAATLGFGQPTPDAVGFVHPQRELEAFRLHDALGTDALGFRLARFPFLAPLCHRRRKEQSRFRTSARGLQMPGFMNDAERHAL